MPLVFLLNIADTIQMMTRAIFLKKS